MYTNNFDILAALEERIDAVGNEPTDLQCTRLIDWIVANVPPALFATAAETVLMMDGPDHVYSELRMRIGEMGM